MCTGRTCFGVRGKRIKDDPAPPEGGSWIFVTGLSRPLLLLRRDRRGDDRRGGSGARGDQRLNRLDLRQREPGRAVHGDDHLTLLRRGLLDSSLVGGSHGDGRSGDMRGHGGLLGSGRVVGDLSVGPLSALLEAVVSGGTDEGSSSVKEERCGVQITHLDLLYPEREASLFTTKLWRKVDSLLTILIPKKHPVFAHFRPYLGV